ncbi:hypothetical protein SEA_YDN12_66 [Streptomyces phage YDN12]|uniref:Uncharacterized protein n=1 Tax=Streptomyces phage YDN12 TaxID=1636183 RepID=A0A0E3JQI1_9CAUD|nr:hypothetical protein AVT63_gp65 [Streptomyces phage YDN12]AKA61733.1 hypothetical protein SEA_YDN12_66 [Streptomyces phage YDN12]
MNSNTDVFAPSNTGTKAHAFLGSRGAKDGNLRAACRVTIQRSVSATFVSLDRARKFYSVCDSCVKLFRAAEDRAEASMQPATEAHDLGYVAPVDERTETPQQDAKPARTMGEYLAERRAAKVQHAPGKALLCGDCQGKGRSVCMNDDLAAEDGTVKLGHDTLTRKGPWGIAVLGRRTYAVSLLVHRKTEGEDPGNGHRVYWDHVIYWNESTGGTAGPLRAAGSIDAPHTVAGRIWSLLVAANIA